MKGKKFDAAEKHFEKKRLEYEKQIRKLKDLLEGCLDKIETLETQNEHYARENESLNDWIERLLEYTELTKEDIKKVCEKDKKAAEAFESLSVLSKLFVRY